MHFTYKYVKITRISCVCVCIYILCIFTYVKTHAREGKIYKTKYKQSPDTEIVWTSFIFRCFFHDALSIPVGYFMTTKGCGRKRP